MRGTGSWLGQNQVVGPESVCARGEAHVRLAPKLVLCVGKLDSMFNDHIGQLANDDIFFGRRLGWTELALCRRES